jgi:2,4-dienoyl-CoA reductase-like NADH-dependent reductase (Old Yellow Enzyme family)/thioredoxin reductase
MKTSLWDGISIGNLSIPNRTVMPAMGTGYATPDGQVTDRLKAYLKKRAEGGVGLIITEVCAIHPSGKGFLSELGVYDDSFLPGLEELAGAVKKAGSRVALQLHHAGRETSHFVTGQQPVAPSPLPSRAMGQVPRELSGQEIAELVAAYGDAARRAKAAGFDAVEVHGAHGYLVNQFLSPYSNHRQDQYGGGAEGRFRFALEVVREIKSRAGKDFPLIFRFSSTEMVEKGYDLEYILPLLPLLEEAGVDAFHVSCGIIDSPGNPTCPGMHHSPGINVERAARVKREVGVPVIVVGKIHDPRLAEEIVTDGKADMVAFGRQHLADPMFLSKAREGRHEDIRFCLSCNQGCIERLALELKPITCVINPQCGEEWKERGGKGKKGPFLVVGAGPAGLQAAMVLGENGAVVRIAERETEPGGQLRAASRPEGKEALKGWVDWAVARLEAMGIGVETGAAVDKEILRQAKWEGVVMATGARPVIPDLPGARSEINAEARNVLLGRSDTGRKVLVVGAGPVGMETAGYLMERGKEVVVVEEKEAPPMLPLTSHGYYLHRNLRKKGQLLLGTRVVEVKEEGVVVDCRGSIRTIEVDTVVWAVGSEPEREITHEVEELGLVGIAVGDLVEPRRILEAVHEGAQAAERLLFEEES